jgi:hypothetical protein
MVVVIVIATIGTTTIGTATIGTTVATVFGTATAVIIGKTLVATSGTA